MSKEYSKRVQERLNRKQLPNILRINEKGELYCADNRDTKRYLREIREDLIELGFNKDEPMILVPREAYQKLLDERNQFKSIVECYAGSIA